MGVEYSVKAGNVGIMPIIRKFLLHLNNMTSVTSNNIYSILLKKDEIEEIFKELFINTDFDNNNNNNNQIDELGKMEETFISKIKEGDYIKYGINKNTSFDKKLECGFTINDIITYIYAKKLLSDDFFKSIKKFLYKTDKDVIISFYNKMKCRKKDYIYTDYSSEDYNIGISRKSFFSIVIIRKKYGVDSIKRSLLIEDFFYLLDIEEQKYIIDNFFNNKIMSERTIHNIPIITERSNYS